MNRPCEAQPSRGKPILTQSVPAGSTLTMPFPGAAMLASAPRSRRAERASRHSLPSRKERDRTAAPIVIPALKGGTCGAPADPRPNLVPDPRGAPLHLQFVIATAGRPVFVREPILAESFGARAIARCLDFNSSSTVRRGGTSDSVVKPIGYGDLGAIAREM